VIKDKALLATSFYNALLQQDKPSFGKHNQQNNQEALKNFFRNFTAGQSDTIEELLKQGYYYPQEALNKEKALEGWKTIYEIVVPKWNEEDGKGRIRVYIYELLGELEKETFLNREGEEDIKKVKKYIRDQFRLKQLMELVLGNDVIKVKSCKVSSIKSIISQRFSWEFSTKWSGGEKWSKNMSLFLGILNYLAEKKQNIYERLYNLYSYKRAGIKKAFFEDNDPAALSVLTTSNQLSLF
jgi:hypothetical protein